MTMPLRALVNFPALTRTWGSVLTDKSLSFFPLFPNNSSRYRSLKLPRSDCDKQLIWRARSSLCDSGISTISPRDEEERESSIKTENGDGEMQEGTPNDDTADDRITLRELCSGMVSQDLLQRAEEVGFKYPTSVQQEALPLILSGQDCILHAQTGSGKTLAYLLPTLTKIVPTRAAVQAIVVVPTRELGMQVARVARMLVGKGEWSSLEEGKVKKEKGNVTVMTLLDGGSSSRQKSWLKAEPPKVVVGTLESISRLIETKHLRTNAISTIVIDEVDAMVGAAKEGGLLQKLLSVHTRPQERQTILASATIPQHRRFLIDCIQNKWAKENIVHIHVSPEEKIPSFLHHRYVVCEKEERLQALFSVLEADAPRAAIIFVNDQSEKSSRAGDIPSTVAVADFLAKMNSAVVANESNRQWEPLILEEDAHINARASSLSEFREGRCLLIATELAARGLDLPEVSHVYNLEWPTSVTSYIHRAGRTGRRPITQERGTVTSFITSKELFVLHRVENELLLKFTAFRVLANSVD